MLDKTNIRGKRIQAADVALGASIRLRRVTLGLSQQDLADALGVTFQQVQKYENGTNRIAAGRLIDMAKKLNCSPARLLGQAVDATAGAVVDQRFLLVSRSRPASDLMARAASLAEAGRDDAIRVLVAVADQMLGRATPRRLPALNGKVQR